MLNGNSVKLNNTLHSKILTLKVKGRYVLNNKCGYPFVGTSNNMILKIKEKRKYIWVKPNDILIDLLTKIRKVRL